ncbi:MAG: DUF58 domain-containing protein [Candidatus Aenigmarchaeota archaeon]|nr:DUF58 domain-containing protein [Candidatus Aenigmarchaeota archaeon]
MRRVIINRIVKRAVYGVLFVLASYAIAQTGIQRWLLGMEFDILFLDFIYVLFVTFLPEALEWIGYGILFSVAILLVKYRLYPVHRLERHYLGIKRGSMLKYVLICGVMAVLLFLVPYFVRQPPLTGEIVAGMNQFIMQAGTQASSIGGYPGQILGTVLYALAVGFNFFVIGPLYLFSSVRLDAFIAALFLSPLFFHATVVSLSRNHVSVSRSVSKHLCQEGERLVLSTSLSSSFPAPNMSIGPVPVPRKRKSKWKMRSRKSLSFMSVENSEDLELKEGYYNFDIVPVTITTFPFLKTTVYKVCDANADISVIPPLHFKTRMYIRKPSVVKETDSLIRKQLGSSLDFAGIREYQHGDPLSRVWWKGLAKSGKMLVKQFHSFSEDRWMLVLDMTNPNLPEDAIKGMMQFSRIFIELCTRKDISTGLSTFAPSFYYIDYEINKRTLLSGLTKVTMPLYEISTKGVELILQDALGPGLEKLKRKCREKHMTLSMVYSYSGLGKKHTYMSWRGENIFKSCTRKFFTQMRKSGKIVLITDGSPGNMEMFKRFKEICDSRRYPYTFIITEPNKETMAKFKRAKIKHIYVPYDRLATPGFVMGLVSFV